MITPFFSRRGYLSWMDFISYYTTCKLTYPTDRLAAIAGYAKAMARTTGERYVAGLWESQLPVTLAWMRNQYETAPRRLPFHTWSWASVSATTDFRLLLSSPLNIRLRVIESMLSNIQVEINGSLQATSCSDVQEGNLIITGYVRSALVTEADMTDDKWYKNSLSVFEPMKRP
ncbi:hypothetical protein GE09DRAFT_53 [Coniochaeta sp. 2T2.1]|nr:hypothetical protein GE09DRAFT_53 [Coniochaeta sp. 2T2.1]